MIASHVQWQMTTFGGVEISACVYGLRLCGPLINRLAASIFKYMCTFNFQTHVHVQFSNTCA
jgi:hypothetical protein